MCLKLFRAGDSGIVDGLGEFTGDGIAFVYPDLKTALVGTFEKGIMISGYPAALKTVEIISDIAEPVFSVLDGPTVGYCRSSGESIGEAPLVRDPYEETTVQVCIFLCKAYKVDVSCIVQILRSSFRLCFPSNSNHTHAYHKETTLHNGILTSCQNLNSN